MIKVAIDAMGGDESPEAIVKGAVESLGETEDTKLFLFGPKERISTLLSQYSFDRERVELVNAEDVISLHESPVLAHRGGASDEQSLRLQYRSSLHDRGKRHLRVRICAL